MLLSALLLSLHLSAEVDYPDDDASEPRREVVEPVRSRGRPPGPFKRPVRKDEPLREINISDIEVREIETLMKERYPAAIVYISPVTTGCPCEDGSLCTDQVWSIAQQNDRSYELALSRIDEEWQVGPLQEWWLTRDKIMLEMQNWREMRAGQQERQERFQTYMDFVDRLAKHNEAYPVCTTD